ncbi:MAG: hypothetical protein L3J66_07095 [Bacteroidales bacterium]|nr:hypothetical protein [Bacteroidales bacterium]
MANYLIKQLEKILPLDSALRYSRLRGSLTTFKAELDFRIKNGKHEDAPWAVEAKRLLKESEEFLELRKFDEAWKCFHTAQRQEIFGMTDGERTEICKTLISETVKLNSWRRKAIEELIGKPETEGYSAPPATTVVRATALKDEHYNNLYYQNRLTAGLYRMLFALLAIVTALLFFFVSSSISESGELPEYDTMMYGIILFGLLGAITSSILFTRNQAAFSRISEISTNTFIVLSKIAVGVGFTIFIYFLLRSSLLDSIQLLNFSISRDVDYYTIAFVSGFTERIAQKALNLIIGGEEKKKP